MKRVVFLGDVGAFNCKRVDPFELRDQYANTGITGHKVFLSSSGTQVPGDPLHAFRYDKERKTFLIKGAVINPEFEDRLEMWGDAMLADEGDFCVVLFNRSHLKSRSGKFAFQKNPFRNNDIGLNWGDDNTVKYLYDSITFGGNNKVTYHWKKWVDVDEKKLKFQFSDVGDIGKALSAYVQTVANILVPIAKKHNGRLFIIGRNEERAGVEGDRSELNVFEKECFERAGVKQWGKK